MHTLQPAQSQSHTFLSPGLKISFSTRFFKWCIGQEQYRLAWLAAILAIHGCMLTPITVLAVFAGGNSIVMWPFAIGAMAIALISNLAAMPTKYTIPIFFFSVLIDVALIVIGLTSYFAGQVFN